MEYLIYEDCKTANDYAKKDKVGTPAKILNVSNDYTVTLQMGTNTNQVGLAYCINAMLERQVYFTNFSVLKDSIVKYDREFMCHKMMYLDDSVNNQNRGSQEVKVVNITKDDYVTVQSGSKQTKMHFLDLALDCFIGKVYITNFPVLKSIIDKYAMAGMMGTLSGLKAQRN